MHSAPSPFKKAEVEFEGNSKKSGGTLKKKTNEGKDVYKQKPKDGDSKEGNNFSRGYQTWRALYKLNQILTKSFKIVQKELIFSKSVGF